MKLIFAVLAFGLSTPSFADGFRCDGLTYGKSLVVYNHTAPRLGTRVAAIMIAADPKLKGATKTIATFKNTQGLLTSRGTVYSANVDSRFTGVTRSGENIAGTKLGFLKSIRLSIDFSYASDTPSNSGEKFSGVAKYTKESGEVRSENMVCVRYIKSPR
jgi:hypothetical protein